MDAGKSEWAQQIASVPWRDEEERVGRSSAGREQFLLVISIHGRDLRWLTGRGQVQSGREGWVIFSPACVSPLRWCSLPPSLPLLSLSPPPPRTASE